VSSTITHEQKVKKRYLRIKKRTQCSGDDSRLGSKRSVVICLIGTRVRGCTRYITGESAETSSRSNASLGGMGHL